MSTHSERSDVLQDGPPASHVMRHHDTTIRASAARAADRPDALAELIQDTLRCALRPSASDAEVCGAMRRVCVVAHEEGWLSEQLLVVLKKAWRELPETRWMLRDTRETTLSGLITLCIKEYYEALRALRAQP